MKGKWKDEEVKSLFKTIEEYKGQNRPIREAFARHSENFNRQPNSVRNYYYHEVDSLKEDFKRREALGINISLHEKVDIVYFSKEEEESLMKKIDELVKGGMSIRKACITLADGDADKLLRYQNKYRNLISKSKTPKESNIVAFKKPSKALSEGDIQSLFMGLVRLVKKNALIEGEEKYKEKLNHANNLLRKALSDLQSQEREIDKLKERYIMLKNENNSLAEKVMAIRSDKAQALKRKLERMSPSEVAKKS